MIEEAKKNCEETIEDFLGILEKLRPTNQGFFFFFFPIIQFN